MKEREFRERVLSMHDAMFVIALRLGFPSDECADLVQETQISLWRNRDKIPADKAHCKAYCIRVFRNACIDAMRSRRSDVPLDDLPEIPTPPLKSAEYEETRRLLQHLIGHLPRGQREAMILSGFLGLDYKEIAQKLNTTEANVRQLLSRARRQMKNDLNQSS